MQDRSGERKEGDLPFATRPYSNPLPSTFLASPPGEHRILYSGIGVANCSFPPLLLPSHLDLRQRQIPADDCSSPYCLFAPATTTQDTHLREASDKPPEANSSTVQLGVIQFKRFCGSVENKGSFIISFELLLASSLSKRTSSVQEFAAPPSLPSPAIQLSISPRRFSSPHPTRAISWNLPSTIAHISPSSVSGSFPLQLALPKRPLDATSQRLHTNRAPRPRHCTSTFSS